MYAYVGVRFPPGYLEKQLHITSQYSAHARFQLDKTTKMGEMPLFFTNYKPGTTRKKVNTHLAAAMVGWFLGGTASAVIQDDKLAHQVARYFTFTESGDTEEVKHKQRCRSENCIS